MNTKTTKFLAVLAILAMAFAVFAVIAPVETQDAVNDDPAEITVKLTKTAGIEYTIGGEVVSGTVKVPVNTILTVTVLFGYDATDFSITHSEIADFNPVENGKYQLSAGGTVKVKGVKEITFSETTVTGNQQLVTCGPKDEVIVSDYLTIETNDDPAVINVVTINGILYVPADAVLTIQKNTKLVINGLLYVEGSVIVDPREESDPNGVIGGTIIVNDNAPNANANVQPYLVAQPEMEVTGVASISGDARVFGVLTVENSMIIQEEGYLKTEANSKVYVYEDAVLAISGSAATYQQIVEQETVSAPIYARGTVLIDSSDIDARSADPALVEFKVGDGASVIVTKFGGLNGSKIAIADKDGNEIGITISTLPAQSPQGAKVMGVVSGIIITDAAKVVKEKTTYVMDLNGTPAVTSYYIPKDSEAEPENLSAKADISVFGKNKATISESLITGKNVSLTVKGDVIEDKNVGTLEISGSVDMTADKSDVVIANTGTITMSGEGIFTIYKNEAQIGGMFNATKWTVTDSDDKKLTTFTTLDEAIVFMNADGNTVTSYSVFGTQTVTKSASIPAGITIDANGIAPVQEPATPEWKTIINIGKKDTTNVILLINESAKTGLIKGNAYTEVNVNGTLIAENKTNLSTDFKKSVKSDVMSEELNEKGEVVSKGWIKWTNIYSAVETAMPGEVIDLARDVTVSNSLTIPEGVIVTTANNVSNVPDGFTITVDKQKTLTVDGVLVLDGKASAVILTEGTQTEDPASLVVNGTIMLSDGNEAVGDLFDKYKLAGAYYDLTDEDAGETYHCMSPVEVAAPIATIVDDAEIELKAVATDKIIFGDIALLGIPETESSDAINPKMTISASVIAGTIAIDEATVIIAKDKQFAGTVADPLGSLELKVKGAGQNGATISSITDKDEQILTMTGAVTDYDGTGTTFTADGIVLLNGVTSESAKLTGVVGIAGVTTIDKVDVSGIVAVDNDSKLVSEDITVSGALGAAEKTDKKGKGSIETERMYVGVTDKILVNYVVADAAVLSGEVKLTDYLLMDPAATIPESFANTDLFKSTQFYVEGKLYLIAIVPVGADVSKDIGNINGNVVDNAKFKNWADSKGENVNAKDLGNVSEVYGSYQYDIYRVNIKTDAGIKEVKIGDIMMLSPPAGENVFWLAGLVAGTYKVTYTLINGYEGEAILTTEMGTVLKDNSITLAGNVVTTFNFQLTGTEPIPEPEPAPTPEEQSEWTITTILLVILVILIAIMAVIVALRLNRS